MEKVTVVLGASPKPTRFSYKAVNSLYRRNIPVIPIGNKHGDIKGIEIVLNTPPLDHVHTVSMYLNPGRQKEYYKYIVRDLRPRRIIFNPGSQNPELAELARKEGIEVVEDCMLVMLNSGKF